MPLKSKAQLRACWAKNDPKWDCREMYRETKNFKKLPERVKEAMVHIGNPFSKIAESLFDPNKYPQVPKRVIKLEERKSHESEKMKGMSPTEYRRHLASIRSYEKRMRVEELRSS